MAAVRSGRFAAVLPDLAAAELEPASVFKSSDGGETSTDCRQVRNLPETQFWTFPRPPHLAHVKDIAVRQEDHKVIFGAIEEGWVIRSTDGGETWETLKQGVEFDAHFVTVMPDDPNVVVVTSGTGVYRSENGGETFVKSDRGIRGALASYMSPAAVHPSRPRTLFAGAADAPPPFWRARAEGANAGFLS